MKKGIFVFLLSIAVFGMMLSLKPYDALASSYREEIRVGLKNMSAQAMDISLSGKYASGENDFQSGTSYRLSLKNGRVVFNGREYDVLTLTPEGVDNLMTIKVTYTLAGKTLAKEYSYRGAITFKESGGQILPINTVNIEDYLVGVVPYEMSNSFHLEALKAQAVAARNYALANLGKHGSEGYDVDDSTHCQVYRGYNSYYKNTIKAVEETAGLLLFHKGKLVNAYFSASNGGYTEACENVWLQTIAYLKAKPDIYDNDGSYNWVRSFTTGEIQTKLREKGYISSTDTFVKLDIASVKTYESGRVSKLDIVYKTSAGQEKIRSLSKEAARIFLSLNSSMYTLSYSDGKYTFDGRGNGHGIGLSQIGALARARAGQSFDAILTFYYDGAYLEAPSEAMRSLSINKKEVLKGNETVVTSEAEVGRAPLYKFVVKRNDQVVYTEDFKEINRLKYTPSNEGEYVVEAYIKDKYSRKEYDDFKSLKFIVYNPPDIKEMTLEPGKIYLDKPLKIKAVSQHGSPEGVLYRFELLNSGKIITSRDWGEGTAEFKVSEEGSYEVRAFLKDKLSEKDYDAVKSIKFTAEKEAQPANGGKQEFTFARTLRAGMRGEDVSALQSALKALKFFSYGSITNYFGSVTDFSLRAFQSSQGLTVNGILDLRTAEKINAELIKAKQAPQVAPSAKAFKPARTLRFGVVGEDVRELQTILKQHGCFVYPSITNYFGAVTRTAVIDFQRKNGLVADGFVGPKTVEKMNSYNK